MNRLSLFVVALLYAMPVQALSFPWEQEEFTPTRCAGLILCIGSVCQTGLKGWVLLGTGLVLVTDNTSVLSRKIWEFKHDVVSPARAALAERIDALKKQPSA